MSNEKVQQEVCHYSSYGQSMRKEIVTKCLIFQQADAYLPEGKVNTKSGFKKTAIQR